MEFQFISIFTPQADWWPILKKEVQHDPFYEELKSKGSSVIQRDGVWFRKGKALLSSASSFIPKIVMDCHPTPTGGHFWFHKTLTRIKQDFFWSNMRRTVKAFLQQCEACQRFKSDCMKQAGLFQPLTVPTQVWIEVSMDFIEGLPSSH